MTLRQQDGPATRRWRAPLASMPRTKRARLIRGIQYAVFVAVLLLIAFRVDWATIREGYFNLGKAKPLFPDIIVIALKNTVIYTAMGFAFGLVAGLVFALMRLSSVLPYRWFANVYIEFFRGIPLLLWLFFLGYGVPTATGQQLPFAPYSAIVLGLGMPAAAYLAETIRAGIQAVPRGQVEAARSLGMTQSRAMISIVIPQAFRIIIPPLTNELIVLTKDSSLVAILGVAAGTQELTKFGRDELNALVNATPLVIAGLCYLLITVPLSLLVRRLEVRNARAR
ncbi:MAG: amino acid ABC transporter permease [Mycobacteriales bacterium]